ncbi:MAG: hypothetical protein C7B46_06700, partial [Sulfobacillus benefaciens]
RLNDGWYLYSTKHGQESLTANSTKFGTISTIAEAISGTHKPITLKLDCEGCEFDVVGNSESRAAFGHPRLHNIILEYHFRSPQMIIETITHYGFHLSRHEAKGPVGLLFFSKEVS